MFVYAARLSLKKLAVGLIAAAAVAVGAAALLPQGSGAVAAADTGSLHVKLETNEDHVAFLRSYGWEVDETPVRETEVRLPDTFDSAYESYAALQRRQGLPLDKYRGKRAMLYVYSVSSHPSGEEGVTASLVTHRDRLIAADLCSADPEGFLHGVTEHPAS